MRGPGAGVILAVACLSGCHRPVEPVEPTQARIVAGEQFDFDTFWEGCQDELREHRFELDRVDRHAGVITTLPETSQSFFEFWRHDVDTAFDFGEASLRSVRRQARVELERDANDRVAGLRVTVLRQTFATPERQFNNSAASLRVFGESLPGVRGEPYLTRANDYWIDDGRDGAMERRLLARILARTGVGSS